MIFIIDSKHHSVINLEKTNKLFLSPSNEKDTDFTQISIFFIVSCIDRMRSKYYLFFLNKDLMEAARSPNDFFAIANQ